MKHKDRQSVTDVGSYIVTSDEHLCNDIRVICDKIIWDEKYKLKQMKDGRRKI